MQQWNIRSLNNTNKLYNYQMFEPDEQVKSTRSTEFIIEGLTEMTKSTAVSNSAINFDQKTADHVACSITNKIMCDEIYEKYKAQSRKVDKLKADYMSAEKTYNDCNNNKNTCSGLEITIQNTQKQIDEYDNNIKEKSSILGTCNADKDACEQINQKIADKKKQISDLMGTIATKEALYKKSNCIA
jgi:flagellar biosynthesis chaperone FliJ